MQDNKLEIQNDVEGIYEGKLTELLEGKRKGDWLLVAELVGISSKNAEVAFNRIYSKNHKQVVTALQRVINNRKSMLQNPK
ncbi:hypothetical protein ACVWYG_002552 [Pedobacter sp. UYEF25]